MTVLVIILLQLQVVKNREGIFMVQNKKLNLFISYSHKDDTYIEEFRKHIAPLKDRGLIEEWYDRKILSGEDYQNKIDNNLEDADIICLFISENFLFSESCKKEKIKALELMKKKSIPVVPIILSKCLWQDYEELSKILALPTDGKPISSYQNKDDAWYDVCTGLKKTIEKEKEIKELKLSEQFQKFLQNVETLMNAHPHKERVILDDIFVHPDLDKYDDTKEYERKINTKELLDNIVNYPYIVISGESQSGKTTLCKVIFKELRKRNLVPVYISDKANLRGQNIEDRIKRSFNEQYEGVDMGEIQERIVPIIDDFHLAKNKEKHLNYLIKYNRCILIVDDIFSLNIKNEKLIGEFSHFKISELKPSLRYDLIKKWVTLGENDNDIMAYKEIDKRTEMINSTLGKTIGKGILPAYPFFILSTILTFEAFAIPLNQEITSQGYCYQALIYFYLRKRGAKNDEIDIYINFLTELAYHIYKEKKHELSPVDFDLFMDAYLKKYNLPIKREILLKNLNYIISADSFNNYSFKYSYIYYFFIAKYLAENIEDDEVKTEIKTMVNNLHIDEYAYITIFMAHHSKNDNILNEIKHNALSLFNKYNPATLSKKEIEFFDKQADLIIEASLPPTNTTPEKERDNLLKIQDTIESQKEENETIEDDDPLAKELRRAFRTLEVIGCIIKNRSGSLEKNELGELFIEAMNINLRMVSYYFEIIRNENRQKDIIDFISSRLKKIVAERGDEKLNENDLRKISRIIFWNINLFIVYGIIDKIAHSLGSDKLIMIVNDACDKVDTPASFIVKHKILMWYNKNLEINEIGKRINEKVFSEVARKLINLIIVEHCTLHPIKYKDRQRIESVLPKIPIKKLELTKILNNH